MSVQTLLSREDLVARYDGRAPRYTSYPTAAQFTPAVDAAVYRNWLGDLDVEAPLSLYLHIPFCERLCWYCGCNTRAVNRPEPIRDYVALMLREIDRVAEALPGRMRAGAVHLGGGTPNMLHTAELEAIFAKLRSVFHLDPAAEISAELDPAVLTEDWVKTAAGVGLNRASVGVQNLAPEVQEAVNRRESFAEIEAAFSWLRAAGVGSINVDLMYGLPRQTTANTLATIDAIVGLQPERLALFGYAHVPWMKPHQGLIQDSDLPGPSERLDQSEAAAERLKQAGYVAIGLDHFALPEDALARALTAGRLHRNFQGYTTDNAPALIGFGASSISALPQGFVQNLTKEADWRRAMAAGALPIARGVALTDEDRFRGEIIERLMCDLKVDLDAICRRHKRSLVELRPAIERLTPFVQDGLISWSPPVIKATAAGRNLIRSVCALFDAHLAPEAKRHSATI
jgi:oxygen-independent coproporphyrinogen-3 oxidase